MSYNDLIDFINSASNQIDEEYFRIQKRAKEDPGSAGDQGEENWAKLLKDWLPPIFQIVTKGRIINSNGEASPQVDIIVLKPEYPQGLLDKKLYLAEGVLAAFECKLTLKAQDLTKFFKNSVQIKRLVPPEFRITDEIQSPIFYGLLAHSIIWKKNERVVDSVSEIIRQKDLEIVTHPRHVPDLICVADIGCWHTTKSPHPQTYPINDGFKQVIFTAYVCEQADSDNNVRAIGSAIKWLLFKLSREHNGLESLSKYFRKALRPVGKGPMRPWPINEVFSEMNLKKLTTIMKRKDYNFPEDWRFFSLM